MTKRPRVSQRPARARLGPGDFQGHAPRYGADHVARAASEGLEGRWFAASRYRRKARVTRVDRLTGTGTVLVGLRVVDDEPFEFSPGQFVGVEGEFEGFGYRRSPYCIFSTPAEAPAFELLVRVVADAPLSRYLGSLRPGDEVAFRGPTGRSMLPREGDEGLELLATGTGIAPFCSLVRHLLGGGYRGPIRLWWGLRLIDDAFFGQELDRLAAQHPNFTYAISLSEPPSGWPGLSGRLTASVPPRLARLGDKRFYLSGNGAMIQEMALALSDLGVIDKHVYKEPFFNARHQADPAIVRAVRERFVAHDLDGPYVRRLSVDADLDPAPARAPGGGRALSPSQLYDLLPAYIAREQLEEGGAVRQA